MPTALTSGGLSGTSTLSSFEPPHERLHVIESAAVLGEKLAEGVDQGRYMITSPTRKPARMGEHQSRVPLPCSGDRLVERCEVFDVLGNDGSSIRGRGTQQFCIRKPDQFSDFLDRNNVVAESPQLDRNGGRVHLVKKKPHPDSSRRSRSQAAISRSAASSLRVNSESISSVNSA